MKYNHKKIEAKWQKRWEEEEIYKAKFPSKNKKYYALIEFPYPSGERLHVGHARSYSAMDALARKRRMQGYNVLYPIGWDAFGLPAENYAIKTGIHPAITTRENIKNAREQAKSWGLSFDWSREINTTDPKYYKWTQWIFVQLFKQGLAYRAEIPVNWCSSCKINLANEEVIKKLKIKNEKLKIRKEVNVCERCGAEVTKRMQKQWMIRITKYAERLLADLEKVDYREDIAKQQREWIGKSDGALLKFKIQNSKFKIETFTTRLDTLYGATALVIAQDKVVGGTNLALAIAVNEHKDKVENYIKEAQRKSELERTELKKKTGVFTGAYAINPINGEKLPIWVADYVLGWYGEGAIMLVPAHDKRDYEFANRYGIRIKKVVKSSSPQKESPFEFKRRLLVDDGVVINSGKYSGLKSGKAREKMLEDGQREGWAKKKTTYKLHDWVFSRQHYWGEPIPMIFCARCAKNHVQGSPQKADPPLAERFKIQKGKSNTIGQEQIDYRFCKREGVVITSQENNSRDGKIEESWDSAGWFPVAEEDLPVKLPYIKRYQPTDTGDSPLANISNWVKVRCPHCGSIARRETDTMPNWAGSSWYFLAYPFGDKLGNEKLKMKNEKYKEENKDIFTQSRDELDYWMPVDWYNGGMEHTTLHLLYSRFWHKFLFDIGVVPIEEPYAKRTSHGVVLGPDGRKMSKSRGNVINPDEIVEKYGADAFRVYEMFIGTFDEAVIWDDQALVGARRFLDRVWRLYQLKKKETPFKFERSLLEKVRRKLHQTIKKVSENIEELKFNTAIAALMEFVNFVYKFQLKAKDKEVFLRLLAPFAPFLAEELWQRAFSRSNLEDFKGSTFKSVHIQPWPEYDPKLIKEETVEFVAQVNGRVREKLKVKSQKSKVKAEMEKEARGSEKVRKYLQGRKVNKTIFVPGKLINFVVSKGDSF